MLRQWRSAKKKEEARYGSGVIAVAMEKYGRFALASLAGLDFLAAAAGENLRDRWAAPRLLPEWRAAVQRAVVYATADIDLLGLGAAAVSTCGLNTFN